MNAGGEAARKCFHLFPVRELVVTARVSGCTLLSCDPFHDEANEEAVLAIRETPGDGLDDCRRPPARCGERACEMQCGFHFGMVLRRCAEADGERGHAVQCGRFVRTNLSAVFWCRPAWSDALTSVPARAANRCLQRTPATSIARLSKPGRAGARRSGSRPAWQDRDLAGDWRMSGSHADPRGQFACLEPASVSRRSARTSASRRLDRGAKSPARRARNHVGDHHARLMFPVRRSARPSRSAGVAQLVEQLIRNQQVTRSSRVAGSKFPRIILRTRADRSSATPSAGNTWVTRRRV